MTQPNDTEITEAYPPEWDHFLSQAFPIALGLALDSDKAPMRCKRRACKLSGICNVKCIVGQPLSCGGGYIADDTLVKACFGAMVALQVGIAAGLCQAS